MTKAELVAAKKRLVALCLEFGKKQGKSKLIEDILTIVVSDPDFSGPFSGDYGDYIQVLGYSFSLRSIVKGANKYRLAVYELQEETTGTDGKVYPAGYKSIKASAVAVEQE